MKIKPGYKQTEVGVIPEDWEVKTLGQIGIISGGGVDKKVQPEEIPVRLVNYMDVYRHGFIRSALLDHVVSAPPEQAARCAVCKGDVYFTPSSELPFDIAVSAVAMEDIPDACHSYHVVRLRLKEDWDLKFRAYAFSTQEFLNQAAKICEGSGVRYVITQGKFCALTVCYPPNKTEQAAIAAALSDVDALLDGLDLLVAKKRAIKLATMQQLLTGEIRLPGFHGEWVTSKINELCEYEFGAATSGGEQEYVEIGDIDVVSKSYDIGGKDKPAIRGAVKVPKGTLLISTVRPTRGAIAITKEEVHVSPAFCRLRPANDFLFHLVCQERFFAYLGDNSFGGTYPTCRDDTILNYECPVPGDPEEQTAIAAVLSDMDTELSALEARREKTRALKYAMMGELLTGKTRLVKPKQKNANA